MISSEALQEFKEIWFEKYGETIPDDFAMEVACDVLTLFHHTYRPIKKDWERN